MRRPWSAPAAESVFTGMIMPEMKTRPSASPAMIGTIPAVNAVGVSSIWMMPTMKMTMKMIRSAMTAIPMHVGIK